MQLVYFVHQFVVRIIPVHLHFVEHQALDSLFKQDAEIGIGLYFSAGLQGLVVLSELVVDLSNIQVAFDNTLFARVEVCDWRFNILLNKPQPILIIIRWMRALRNWHFLFIHEVVKFGMDQFPECVVFEGALKNLLLPAKYLSPMIWR